MEAFVTVVLSHTRNCVQVAAAKSLLMILHLKAFIYQKELWRVPRTVVLLIFHGAHESKKLEQKHRRGSSGNCLFLHQEKIDDFVNFAKDFSQARAQSINSVPVATD